MQEIVYDSMVTIFVLCTPSYGMDTDNDLKRPTGGVTSLRELISFFTDRHNAPIFQSQFKAGTMDPFK